MESKMKILNDPWINGALKSTPKAQRAFDLALKADSDRQEKAIKYHDAIASDDDRSRVDAIEGEYGEICAWYWEDSLNAS
jgi:hypothetical protein